MARVNYRQTGEPAIPAGGLRGWFADRPQMPYILPFVAFVLVKLPEAFGTWAGIPWKSLWHDWHPQLYALSTTLAAILLWVFWNHYTPIRWTKLTWGVLAGLLGTVLWITVEYASQSLGLSHRPNPADFYNPDTALHSAAARGAYLCVRIVGPTLVVPIMEELLFRDFFTRLLVRGARFDDVPVGTFTWFSLIGTSLLFGINHGAQWPEGILYGLLMGVLLVRTKSLGACIVAHGITNWTLYLYVVYFGDWQFM